MASAIVTGAAHSHLLSLKRDEDMFSDTPEPDHATLEAQRRRSNVYAFRRLKWGAPEKLKASAPKSRTPLPFSRPGNGRALNVALLVAVGFVCGVIAVVALG